MSWRSPIPIYPLFIRGNTTKVKSFFLTHCVRFIGIIGIIVVIFGIHFKLIFRVDENRMQSPKDRRINPQYPFPFEDLQPSSPPLSVVRMQTPLS